MAVSGISNTSNTQTGSGTGSINSLADLSQNYETFLRLLTAQLRNQDPLQPQDSAEFTNQLVQFSQVEQQISSNQKLDNLIASVNNGQPNQALGYLGKTVEIQSNGIPLQDGSADFTVSLDMAPTEAVVEITDAKTNKVIRTLTLPNASGTHELEWDGLDEAGNKMEDGTYVANVKATGADGTALNSIVLAFGKVTGVDLTASEPYLMIGNLPITMENVLSIK